MMRRLLLSTALLLAAGLARPAAAQEETRLVAALRGGLGGYTGDLAPVTSPGLEWGVQAIVQPADSLLGAEAAYEGARNGLQGRDGAVVRNGIQGLARLYTTTNREASPRPYVAGGLGLGFIFPTGAPEIVSGTDTVIELPLAAGLEWLQGPFVAGVRASFTPFFGESFADDLGVGGEGGYFGISGTIGGSF